MASRLAVTLLALALGLASTRQPDTVGTAGGALWIEPIAHGTVVLRHGRHVVLIDPARFVPGQPEPPREDLQETAMSSA